MVVKLGTLRKFVLIVNEDRPVKVKSWLGLTLQAAVPALAVVVLGSSYYAATPAPDVQAPAGVFLTEVRDDARPTTAIAPTTGTDRDLFVVGMDNWREAGGSGNTR
jgi:hypothetical protein